MKLFKIIFSCDWEFFSPNWKKSHLNFIGNGALIRPLRHLKKNPGPKVIKHFSCSAQLRLKFIVLINVKYTVGILTFF